MVRRPLSPADAAVNARRAAALAAAAAHAAAEVHKLVEGARRTCAVDQSRGAFAHLDALLQLPPPPLEQPRLTISHPPSSPHGVPLARGLGAPPYDPRVDVHRLTRSVQQWRWHAACQRRVRRSQMFATARASRRARSAAITRWWERTVVHDILLSTADAACANRRATTALARWHRCVLEALQRQTALHRSCRRARASMRRRRLSAYLHRWHHRFGAHVLLSRTHASWRLRGLADGWAALLDVSARARLALVMTSVGTRHRFTNVTSAALRGWRRRAVRSACDANLRLVANLRAWRGAFHRLLIGVASARERTRACQRIQMCVAGVAGVAGAAVVGTARLGRVRAQLRALLHTWRTRAAAAALAAALPALPVQHACAALRRWKAATDPMTARRLARQLRRTSRCLQHRRLHAALVRWGRSASWRTQTREIEPPTPRPRARVRRSLPRCAMKAGSAHCMCATPCGALWLSIS